MFISISLTSFLILYLPRRKSIVIKKINTPATASLVTLSDEDDSDKKKIKQEN